jgi:hypothetical protein
MAIFAIFTIFTSLFVIISASTAPCEQPLNCGEYNKSTVCNHTFTGCDVCDTCCEPWLKSVDSCDGCVQDECASGRHLDCCVSFYCDLPNGQCKRAFSTTGAYPNRSTCEAGCQVPAVICTGSSSDLDQADCSNWVSTDSMGYSASSCGPML